MYDRPLTIRHRAPLFLGSLFFLLLALACGNPPDEDPLSSKATPPVAPPSEAAPVKSPQVPRIVFLGDSLTAGFGLAEEQAFPAVIGHRLAERGIDVKIVNAGVSGDTSAGGLSRIEWLLRQSPDILVVGLGGNDGLRGLSVEMTESNLRLILLRALESGAQPLLLGLRLPPNLGSDYVEAFESIYPRLSDELGVALVPFMLEGVAGDPDLNFPDGIHPTAAGQELVADNVLPWIEEILLQLLARKESGSAQNRSEDSAP